MYIKKVNLIYFSPTNSTKKVLNNISKNMKLEVIEYDLTKFENRFQKIEFGSDDLVIIGMPTYAGRIPNNEIEILKNIKGNNTPIVCVITYGNRAYDDSLLELKTESEGRGFKCVGAGAFVCEHSFSNKMGTNRPNEEDEVYQAKFGKKILTKLNRVDNIDNLKKIKVDGNYPYRKGMKLNITPTNDDTCIDCKMCAKNCPVRAINLSDVSESDNLKCVLCFRCVKNCPTKCRKVRVDKFNENIKLLEDSNIDKKPNKIFI